MSFHVVLVRSAIAAEELGGITDCTSVEAESLLLRVESLFKNNFEIPKENIHLLLHNSPDDLFQVLESIPGYDNDLLLFWVGHGGFFFFDFFLFNILILLFILNFIN